MGRTCKTHPNPNSISLWLKRIRLQSEGQRAVWTHTLNQHQKTQDRTALCFKPQVFYPGFWTSVLSPVFGPSPLLSSDFAGASHFQLVHIHKIKSKWSLVILLCSLVKSSE